MLLVFFILTSDLIPLSVFSSTWLVTLAGSNVFTTGLLDALSHARVVPAVSASISMATTEISRISFLFLLIVVLDVYKRQPLPM